MANWAWFTKAHRAVFRATGGRLGSSLGGIPVVFVDTIGRKTGELRSVPIACYPYEGDVAVSASNNGQDAPPAWWLNLQSHPEVDVQLGTQRYRVRAEEVTGEERKTLWADVIRLNPAQAHHQAKTTRLIPLVRLRRLS